MKIVTSADGTSIAVDRIGSGPAAVLVGGAFNDRSTVAGLAQVLSTSFTVHTYDRRGRGESTDAADSSPDREVDDLAAIIADAGGPAAVFGHSSGGVLALEAAVAGLPITRLAVYEPSYVSTGGDHRPAEDLIDRVRTALAEGDRDRAVELFLTEAANVPAEYVPMMKNDPSWSWMAGLAHTLPYDVALHPRGQGVPAERLQKISVPTLVLEGRNSDPGVIAAGHEVAAAVEGARVEIVEGQDHAVLHHPEAIRALLQEFLAG